MESIRVVLVDDDADLRLLVRTTLESAGGFEIVGEGQTGADAVAIAGSRQPDILLLDLVMPGSGGLEVLPRLREVAPRTKVVIFSGTQRTQMEPLAAARGAVGYLEKGVPARRLVDELLVVTGLIETAEGALGEVETRLSADLASVPRARRFADEALRRWNCADVLDTVSLLVTELVTNAIRHAGSAEDVKVRLFADTIRLEVSDPSPALPHRGDASPDAESGRGLLLVEAMSTDWGAEWTSGGKRVWAEVARWDDGWARRTLR